MPSHVYLSGLTKPFFVAGDLDAIRDSIADAPQDQLFVDLTLEDDGEILRVRREHVVAILQPTEHQRSSL